MGMSPQLQTVLMIPLESMTAAIRNMSVYHMPVLEIPDPQISTTCEYISLRSLYTSYVCD